MNIQLTPEQERIVGEKLKSGQFQSAEEVIGRALQALQEKGAALSSNGKQQDAVREMLAFVEHNSVRLEGVTVKELIREGHKL